MAQLPGLTGENTHPNATPNSIAPRLDHNDPRNGKTGGHRIGDVWATYNPNDATYTLHSVVAGEPDQHGNVPAREISEGGFADPQGRVKKAVPPSNPVLVKPPAPGPNPPGHTGIVTIVDRPTLVPAPEPAPAPAPTVAELQAQLAAVEAKLASASAQGSTLQSANAQLQREYATLQAALAKAGVKVVSK